MMKPFFAALVLASLAGAGHSQEFRLGAPISDFTLHDMQNRPVHYSGFKGQVTVLIFFSTRCPISNAFNYRRNQLYKDFSDRVKFLIADPNMNESLEEIRNYARSVEFDFPVYRDVDNVVADQFGAQNTTDAFVVDSDRVVRYHGYLEDSPNPTRAKYQGLRLAIEAVLAGKPVPMPVTRALGCSIRRVHTD